MQQRIRYLFNSRGVWIATQVDINIFSVDQKWLGWLRDEDQAVITPDGQYLGSVLRFDRFYYLEDHLPASMPTNTVRMPPDPDYPGYPGQENAQELPPGSRDVDLS